MKRKHNKLASNCPGHCTVCGRELIGHQGKYCEECVAAAFVELGCSNRSTALDFLRRKAYENAPDRLHGEQLRAACESALEKWREILADRIGKLNVA